MAKHRIQNYVFLPGVAKSSNAYPNAYTLLQNNKEFIKAEAIAYVNSQITADNLQNLYPNAYTLLNNNKTFIQDEILAWIFNTFVATATTFTASTGIVTTSAAHIFTVGDPIVFASSAGGVTSGTTYYVLTVPTTTTFTISTTKGDSSTQVTLTNASSQSIAVRYTYNTTSCRRDTGYLIDAILYDIRYGGNERTLDFAKNLYQGGSLQLLTPAIEAAGFNKVFDIITTNIFPKVAYSSQQSPVTSTQNITGTVGEAGASTRITTATTGLKSIVNTAIGTKLTVIATTVTTNLITVSNTASLYTNMPVYFNTDIGGLTAFTTYYVRSAGLTATEFTVSATSGGAAVSLTTATGGAVTMFSATSGLGSLPVLTKSIYNFAGYIFDSTKCNRDIGYVIDAYLNDLRYGGNAEIRYIASRFWSGTTPQLSGDRQPEIVTQQWISNLITGNLLPQSAYTPVQNSVARYTNNTITFEIGSDTRIANLSTVLTDVMTNGLSSLPALVNGVTTIRLQGKYDLDRLLLVTNATHNAVIYNFSDATHTATVIQSTGYVSNDYWQDDDFPSFRNAVDWVTTIKFDYNTSTHSATDDVQIFVEQNEMRVRPYDFGTDAIERHRVAQAQSMLDADFEYGLQPTKWQAIGVSRGYPSVYEVPGTDTAVTNVTTDASSGTSGLGESLITVTTSGPHGLTVGQPFTIKSLANSISGFSRAEGTFIINTVPSTTTFTYYAQSKVGTSNGQVLATTYTQLRKAAFYTGASIGNPSFSVFSQGSSGSITSKFATSSGSDQIAFTGTSPLVGSSLSLPTYTVTATTVTTNLITVASTSGLTAGLAVTFGSAVGGLLTNTTYYILSGFTGTQFSVSTTVGGSAFTLTTTTGQSVTMSPVGIPTGTQILGIVGPGGASAAVSPTVNNTITIGASSATFVSTTGILEGMAVSDGAATPTALFVTSVVGNTVNFTGTFAAGVTGSTQIYTGVSGSNINPTGTSAVFSVDAGLGTYSNFQVTTAGSGYRATDRILILGTDLGGASPANDLVLQVSTVDGSGGITAVTFYSGVSTGLANLTNLTGTLINPVGVGATFNVTRSGGSYSVAIVNDGAGYIIGERITVLGTSLGGTSPTNDATLTITNADSSGILAATISGTAITGSTLDFWSALTISEVTTSSIPDSTTNTYGGVAVIQVTYSTPHGLVPGASVLIDITSSGTNHDLARGPSYVEQVPTSTTFRFTARAQGNIDTAVLLSGIVYARPDAYFIHRPFDGGVQLGTGGPQHGAQAIRMSKKYVRYQSGKGINYCTGALFAPSFSIQSISATGTAIGSYITIVMDDVDHGCQVGGVIEVHGVETKGYNNTYTVSDIVNERQLKVQAVSVLANIVGTLSVNSVISVKRWHGATVRAGTFDDQNGIYFYYDGQDFGVGRRSSTFQVAGTVNIARDSNLMTGTNTRFRDQIKAGDRVVIRGMTHLVTNILSQTEMTVNPDYRGSTNAIQAKICLVQDFKIPQRQFNIDKLDGTGPSGFDIDITKMQMIGMQWSWYAVGFIDFMLRGSDGNFIFFHRVRNSNVNTEAYMRTGNQPVRYEVINESARDKLLSSITPLQTTIPLVDATEFPNEAGVIMIDNELIGYTGKSANTLTGCTRATSLTNFIGGAQRTFTAGVASTHEFNTGVILVSNTISPIISHWGSAMLTDGNFDEDRGYLFNYAATNVAVSTTKQTAFLIRLAPSVSNAIVGDLGERELINRAQLLLKSIEVTADGSTGGATPQTLTGGIVVEGVLNPQNYPSDPGLIGWSGLQASAVGGQPSFAQIAPGGSVTWISSTSTTDTTITTQASMTGTITAKGEGGANAGFSGSNYVWLLRSDYNTYINTNGLAVGDAVSGTGIASGATISSFNGPFNWGSNQYFSMFLSINNTGNVPNNTSLTITRTYKTSVTSTIFFPKATWESSGAKSGTQVQDAKFSANTFVNGATLVTFFATQYYRVTFSQTSNSTTITAGSGTVTFRFTQPAYALPGETIFSFIAATGTNSSLELSELKELTNTTLGGRGTYPNGPDVLAINVYKAAGSDVPCNIVLRWSEAQA